MPPQVKEKGQGHDVVAVDFYSRYQRPTAPSCDRFAAGVGAPACKVNRLRWCHTDLGANAIAYPRFLKETRRFGTLGVRGREPCGRGDRHVQVAAGAARSSPTVCAQPPPLLTGGVGRAGRRAL